MVAEDVVVEWPVSAERIVGNKNFVAVNSEPGGLVDSGAADRG
ncbi:hypothetical protein [Streptomyces sp. NBC_01602]